MIPSPPDLRDCVRSLQMVQDALRETHLQTLNLAGENWWMLLRNDFFRAFTARRSAIYRKHFRTVSHSDPGAKLAGASEATSGQRWYGHPLDSEVCLFARDRKLLQPTSDGSLRWAHYGLYRDHNEIVSGKLFNRIADAWLQQTGGKRTALKLCPWEADADKHRFWKDAVWMCGAEPDRSELPWNAAEETGFRAAFAAICAFCDAHSLPYFGDVENALLRIRQCLRFGEQCEMVLSHYRPRFLALSSFYTEDRQPVILAARRCGIPVCDLEHGFMGEYSPYAQLAGIPEAAESWLPAAFWCWGEPSAQFLRSSLGRLADRQSVIGVWGSPWYSFLDRQPLVRFRRRRAGRSFRKRYASYARRLLVVHQPDLQAQGEAPQLLPAHVWEVMGRAGADTLWMLRLHPRSRHLFDDYVTAFEKRGIEHFEITGSSTLSLEALKPMVDGVLTSFSTIALEFSTAGIPFYLIDDFGVAMLSEFIEPPFSFAADSAAKLEQALATASPATGPSVSYYTRIQRGKGALRDLENRIKA